MTPGFARSICNSARMAPFMSPTFTTGSSAITKCRSTIRAATASAAAAGPGNNRQKPALAETLALPRDVKGLVAELGSANLARRMLAMNYLADSIGQPAVAPLKKVLSRSTNWFQKAHALWVLHRLNALDEKAVAA